MRDGGGEGGGGKTMVTCVVDSSAVDMVSSAVDMIWRTCFIKCACKGTDMVDRLYVCEVTAVRPGDMISSCISQSS